LGTVTSVAASVPSFLSIAGSPITTSGTLAITLSGTALPTTSGGTGLTSFTANGVVYASSSSALATGSALRFDGNALYLSDTGAKYINLGTTTNGQTAAFQISAPNSDSSASVYRIGSGLTADNEWTVYDVTNSQTVDKYIRGASGFRAFYQNGSERARIDTSGNLCLGTTSGTNKLTVEAPINLADFYGSTYAAQLIIKAAATNVLTFAGGTSDALAFETGGSERARIDASGNVGIGTSTIGAGNKLNVTGDNVVFTPNTAGKDTFVFTTGAADKGIFRIKNDTTTAIELNTNGASYFNGGNLGVGTTTLYPSTPHPSGSQIRVGLTGNYFSQNSAGLGINGAHFIDNAFVKNSIGDFAYITSAKASRVYARTGEILFQRSSGTDTADAAVNFVTTALMDSAGNTTFNGNISVGGATVTTSGTGITFPATQSASSNANTLDDYEEGTWTPVFTGVGGTNPTVTYGGQSGTYTKIGNRVIWELTVYTSAATGGSGALAISLPLATSNGSNHYHIALVAYCDLLSSVSRSGYTDPGRTDMFFMPFDAANGNLSVSSLTNAGTGYLMMQGQYLCTV
jgi:hypothetical protein